MVAVEGFAAVQLVLPPEPFQPEEPQPDTPPPKLSSSQVDPSPFKLKLKPWPGATLLGDTEAEIELQEGWGGVWYGVSYGVW